MVSVLFVHLQILKGATNTKYWHQFVLQWTPSTDLQLAIRPPKGQLISKVLFGILNSSKKWTETIRGTGKSFSEALILASANPKYNKRLFMKIPSWERVKSMLCTWNCSECQNKNNLCTQHVLDMFWAWNSHVLSLEFLCTELVIQWIICRHIVDYLRQKWELLTNIYLYHITVMFLFIFGRIEETKQSFWNQMTFIRPPRRLLRRPPRRPQLKDEAGSMRMHAFSL